MARAFPMTYALPLLIPAIGASWIPVGWPPIVSPLAASDLDDRLEDIQEATVERSVRILASPAMEGRDSPSRGLNEAMRYCVKRLRKAGFRPAPDSKEAWDRVLGSSMPPAWAQEEEGGIWLRPYQANALGLYRELERPDPKRSTLSQEKDSGTVAFEFGRDFLPLAGCSGDVSGELVFAGFGIRSKRERYDDFKDLRLQGRVALIFEGEPRHGRKFEGEEVTPEASLWDKLETLEDKRVAGVLVVQRPGTGLQPLFEEKDEEQGEQDEGEAKGEEPSERLSFRATWASWVGEPNERRPRSLPPAMMITAEAATRLLGQDAEALALGIEEKAKPNRDRLGGNRITLRSVTQVGSVDLFNVVGYLPGKGRAGEAVVVGAHADHIGIGPRGRIAYGADDNASGVSALLEIAEAMGEAPPERSIFATVFSAEEDGLVGSRAFCEDLPLPKADLVAMVNLDMIGRGDAREVIVLGEAQNPGLKKVLKRAQRAGSSGIRKVEYVNDPGLFQRSDHYSFHSAGIPAVFFFENYPISKNKDYHTWRDVSDKVDIAKVTHTARFAYLTAWTLANDEERLPAPRD